jgi:anti-sigma28 factor (negative regulator of flagellin synthesis)
LKISDASSAEAAGHVQPAEHSASKQTEHAAEPGSVEDHVSLGSVAVAASNSLDAPEPRIAELRQQYVDGVYQVDAGKLGAKIIDEHLQK